MTSTAYCQPLLRFALAFVSIMSLITLPFDLDVRSNSITSSLESISPEVEKPTRSQFDEAFRKLPISFEANQGQADRQVKFISRGIGFNLFLTSTGATMQLLSALNRPHEKESGPYLKRTDSKSTLLRMSLVGASSSSHAMGIDERGGHSNYLIGNNKKEWRADVPSYGKVRFKNVYPRVDLLYYGNQQKLEYDFIVDAYGSPDRIRLGFEGAESICLDSNGDLVLKTPGGEVRQHRPVIYQEISDTRREIAGSYVICEGGRVGFEIGDYEKSLPLIIDPVLSYSTYLGGGAAEESRDIALDLEGNIYITGETLSTDFLATKDTPQSATGGLWDAFVMKLDPSGTRLIYSTYIGGSAHDGGHAIAVDAEGNAYVTGATTSHNFPLKKPFQSSAVRLSEAFVLKLNKEGTALLYSTYLGGSGGDGGNGIYVSPDGSAYVTGTTGSFDFPTKNALNPVISGFTDIFVARFKPNGKKLIYSTYVGGSGIDQALAIAVDFEGNVYITGSTASTDFPTTPDVAQPVFGGGDIFGDGFVVKLNPKARAVVYSTYIGGGDEEIANSIAVDSDGCAYVAGISLSGDFPTTAGAFQTVINSPSDAFAMKLNAAGTGLVYSTYLGGSQQETAYDIAVDSKGNAYITGRTNSFDFPITENAIQPEKGSAGLLEDTFITQLNEAGEALLFSSYIGARSTGSAIAIGGSGNIFIAGSTHSPDFPTTQGAIQPNISGGKDAFLLKIKMKK